MLLRAGAASAAVDRATMPLRQGRVQSQEDGQRGRVAQTSLAFGVPIDEITSHRTP
jgi:hypothetical protein